MNNLLNGGFIVIEGGDGVGKSTAVKILAEKFRQSGIDVVTTRQLGGTPKAEKIRKIILETTPAPKEQAKLAVEAIHDCYVNVIAPAVAAGKVVISDRWLQSPMVYQGLLHGQLKLVKDEIDTLFAKHNYHPDYVIHLTASVETILDRLRDRTKKDSFDIITAEHQLKLQQLYAAVMVDEQRQLNSFVSTINSESDNIDAVLETLVNVLLNLNNKLWSVMTQDEINALIRDTLRSSKCGSVTSNLLAVFEMAYELREATTTAEILLCAVKYNTIFQDVLVNRIVEMLIEKSDVLEMLLKYSKSTSHVVPNNNT